MSDGARRSDAPSRKSDRPSKMFDEPSRISGAIFDWGMRPLVSHMFTANYCRLTLCVPLTTPGRTGRKYRSVCCWDKLTLNAQTGDDHKNMMCACEQLMAAMLNRKTKTLPSLLFFFWVRVVGKRISSFRLRKHVPNDVLCIEEIWKIDSLCFI